MSVRVNLSLIEDWLCRCWCRFHIFATKWFAIFLINKSLANNNNRLSTPDELRLRQRRLKTTLQVFVVCKNSFFAWPKTYTGRCKKKTGTSAKYLNINFNDRVLLVNKEDASPWQLKKPVQLYIWYFQPGEAQESMVLLIINLNRKIPNMPTLIYRVYV